MAIPSSGNGLVRDVFDEVDDKITDILAKADIALEAANDAAVELDTATQDSIVLLSALADSTIADLSAIDYNANTTGVDKAFSTPTEVTLPDPTVGLLTSATIDGLFDRALSNRLQAAVAEERDAVYKASSMGVGMLNVALAARLQNATDKRTQAVSEVALENAVQSGLWLREDAKAIYTDLLSQYATRVQKEGERRGWSQMEINDILTQAKEATDTALAKTNKIADITRQTQEIIAGLSTKTQELITQANFGLVSAMYAAANLSMRGSSGVDYGERFGRTERKSYSYSGETDDTNPDW